MYDAALERMYAATKAFAFGTPGINNVTRWRRARAVDRGYARILQHYESRPSPGNTIEELLLVRGGDWLQAFRQLGRHRASSSWEPITTRTRAACSQGSRASPTSNPSHA